MIVTTQQLKEYYANYVDFKGKIAREIKKGNLFPLVKGIYETDPKTYGAKLAQFIYGPSYLSFDYALYYYGLIPEAVYSTFTCATYNKRKTKTYKNKFGYFVYRDVPKEAYSLGIKVIMDGNYSYQIATPEKAICDKLYTLSPIKNVKELKEIVFEYLRIYEDEFEELNKEDIIKIASKYHAKNLNLLIELVKGEK